MVVEPFVVAVNHSYVDVDARQYQTIPIRYVCLLRRIFDAPHRQNALTVRIRGTGHVPAQPVQGHVQAGDR